MSKVQSYKGESAVNIAVRSMGHIEGLVQYCIDNGVAVDSEEAGSSQRLINDELVQELKLSKPMFPSKVIPKTSSVTSYKDESATDIVIRTFGNIEAMVKYCVDNLLPVDYEETAAAARLIDQVTMAEVLKLKPIFPQAPVAALADTIINNGQNVIDLAIQEMGSVEGLISILRRNDLGVNDNPSYGSSLKIVMSEVIDSSNRASFRDKKVNTGYGSAVVTGRIFEYTFQETFN